jgi:iron(III) transport system ATP-binding protein
MTVPPPPADAASDTTASDTTASDTTASDAEAVTAAPPAGEAQGGVAPTALEVHGLVKRFGSTTAVDGVSFTVGAHEVVCLVGPSGCGKSTVLRMLAGLVRPDAGTVGLRGRLLDGDGEHVAPERRRIGIVFQDHALFPNLTVGDNVAFGLARRDRAAKRARVAEMLSMVSLDDHGDRYPHELSGGERQRVALARALAPEPEVLLLDEPFASLDHNLRLQVRADVLDILRATGTPSVFVTHDQREALALGDRVVVLRAGRVEQDGTPAEVFHRPANRFVATFMGEADFLPITVDGDVASSELGPVEWSNEADLGPSPVLVVRPDDLTFDADPHGAATVEHVEFQGSSVLYRLRMGSGATVLVRRPHTVDAPVGSAVQVRFAEHHRSSVVLRA